MKQVIVSLALFATLSGSAAAMDARISGDYLEARTSDVYTGPCFANGEVNLVGKEAIMAWRVRRGGWNGVELEGLSVVAVVRTDFTLGDPHAVTRGARSVLLVDARASRAQRRALADFARSAGGELVKQIVWVKAAPIEVDLEGNRAAGGVRAGDFAEIRTRGLNHTDHLCGNEEIYYPPLTELAHYTPAVTLVHRFQAEGLGSTWSSPGKRSAFVGTFAR